MGGGKAKLTPWALPVTRRRGPANLSPPGDLRHLTALWYRHRLGLLDATSRGPSSAAPLLAALDHYLAMLLGAGPGDEPRCWTSRMMAKLDRGEWRWEWTGTLRPGAGDDGKYRHGRRMTVLEVLGNLFRAALWLRVSPGGSAVERDQELLSSMHDGVWVREESRRFICATPSGEQPVHRREVHRLRFPSSAMWIRTAPSHDRLGYVVVDLDFKLPGDEPRFRALLRLLTTSPGIPRPHLIVTSRRGLGRHLYFLHDNPAMGALSAKGSVFGADEAAKAMKSALARVLGLGYWPRPDPSGLEVFPKDRSAGNHMPYLPFSAGTFLCDERGEVVEREPMACLVSWHHRWRSAGMRRYTMAELSGATADGSEPGLVMEARRLVLDQAATVAAKAGGSAEGDDDADDGVAAPRRRRDGIRDALRVYEDGPTPGEASREVLLLARYRRFHCTGDDDAPDPEDARWFAGWIARHPRPDPDESYAAKFRNAYRDAREPLAGWSSTGMALCPGDVRWVAAQVIEDGPGWPWPMRRCLMKVWLYFIARARDLHPEASGTSLLIDIHNEDIERRGSKVHVAQVRRLIRSKRITLKRKHARPNVKAGRPTGIVRAYTVELPPPGGDMVEVSEAMPDALLASAMSLSDGRRLMGATNWRRLMARLAQDQPPGDAT